MSDSVNMEELIINIIVKSGEAKSYALEAIQGAKQGKFAEAKELLANAEICLSAAHNVQTSLIQAEAGGKHTQVTLLLVHAQDHLMTAMTTRDLALEIVDLYIAMQNK